MAARLGRSGRPRVLRSAAARRADDRMGSVGGSAPAADPTQGADMSCVIEEPSLTATAGGGAADRSHPDRCRHGRLTMEGVKYLPCKSQAGPRSRGEINSLAGRAQRPKGDAPHRVDLFGCRPFRAERTRPLLLHRQHSGPLGRRSFGDGHGDR